MTKRPRPDDKEEEQEELVSLGKSVSTIPSRGSFPLESIELVELKNEAYLFLGDIHPWGCHLCKFERHQTADPTWACHTKDGQTHPRYLVGPAADGWLGDGKRNKIDEWFMKFIVTTNRPQSSRDVRRAEFVLDVIAYGFAMDIQPIEKATITKEIKDPNVDTSTKKITYEDIKADNAFGVDGSWVLETVKERFPDEDPADVLRKLNPDSWITDGYTPQQGMTCLMLHEQIEALTHLRQCIVVPVFLDGHHDKSF